MFSSSDSLRPTSSRPSNITEPPTTLPGGWTMPMIELAVTDLPQPDSPTIPSVCPRSSVERDAVDRMHLALAGPENGAKVVDLEQRHGSS